MFGTISNIFEGIVNFFTGGGSSTERLDPSDPCNAVECVAAKERLAEERRSYEKVCLFVRGLNGIMNVLSPVLATPIWLIVFFLLIALFIGGLIATIILGAIGMYLLAWYLVTFLFPVVAPRLAEALATAEVRVRTAITTVVATCPNHCQGDVSPPECKLDEPFIPKVPGS